MLILTRKPEEVIRLGDNITVKVLSIKNGQVKLGIEAPKELRVYRAEIYEQVQRQNAEAAKAQKSAAAKAAARLGFNPDKQRTERS